MARPFMRCESLRRRHSIKNQPGDAGIRWPRQNRAVKVMGSHTFDLPSIDLSADEASPLDESQSESWALAKNVLLNLASAFPLAEPIAEQSASRFFVSDVNPVTVALPEVDARYRTL